MLVWDTACLDWKDRILAGKSLVPDLPLFENEAALAIRSFNRLRLPDVIGTPKMEDASGAWFLPIVKALFGSYDRKRNARMIQEYFLLVPKKNGKSSYSATLMVVAMVLNMRPEAEFLLIAPTKTIADISFSQAKGIIKLDAGLSRTFQIQTHVKTITHRLTGAKLQVKAADTDAITGAKSTGILIDETHEFAKRSNADAVFLEVRGSLAARPDGFLIQITTQSKDRPSGLFKSELQIARAVRDGKLQLPNLSVLYELPLELTIDGGWKDRKLWPLVNPNLGLSVNETFLVNELIKAEEKGDAQLALLASQHFNVEIGAGLNTEGWAGAPFWDKNVAPALTLKDVLALCECVVVGIDGGGMDDLLGMAVLGRRAGTRDWLLWTHAWAHRCVLTRRKSIAQKLLDFEKDGDLTLVDDDSDQDVKDVVDIILQIEDLGLLPEKKAIGVDPVGITDIVDELELRHFDASLEGGRVVGIRQGWSLNSVIDSMARRLARGEMMHPGAALMRWSVDNAKVVPRGNASSIEKANAGDAKIDPLIATLDAGMLMGMNPEAKGNKNFHAWVA